MKPTVKSEDHDEIDIAIIGAGISGINAAFRIKTELPGFTYTILEGRANVGGTWDLFRYPGIRSDSDLQTFGFSWKPWAERRAMADGPSIRRYIKSAAAVNGIFEHIRFQHAVKRAEWSSKTRSWTLTIQTQQDWAITIHAKFLVLATGYYDYETPLNVNIPGLDEHFKGRTIHPQFWPDQLDYTDKKIVIIGSGATAITLLPNLTDKAVSVTMLQRSPSYIMALPNTTGTSWIHKLLPASWSFQFTRLWFLLSQVLIYSYCRAMPDHSRNFLQTKVAELLPDRIALNPHFTPTYRPWDQRLCFSPDGDFFAALRQGKAHVATGTIKAVRENDILLQSGEEIEADIIVTATGLKIGIGTSLKLSVDGREVHLGDKLAWQSVMLQDIPNLWFMLGYTNAPWTLGADASAWLVVRLLRYVSSRNLTSATPRLDSRRGVEARPLWNLKATYVSEGAKDMPSCGDWGPWLGRTNYFRDLWRSKYGDIVDGLEFRS